MEFYLNTIPEWLLACLIILASFVVAKIFYWTCKKIFLNLTKKTKTTLDDILLDMLEEPVVFGIILVGIWFSTLHLEFFDSIQGYLEQAFYILFTINITWLISRLIMSLIVEFIEPLIKETNSDLDDHLLPILKKGINATIWILGIIVGLNNAGINVGALLAGMGIGGIAFAMASKDTIANLFAGFTIFTDHPFKIGDRIKTSEFDGYVIEIGLRTTRIKTLQGRVVIIPNEMMTTQTIENISLEEFRRVSLVYYLSNTTSSDKITEAIREIDKVIGGVKLIIWHKALLNVFNEYSMGITLLYNITPGEDYFEVQDNVNRTIRARLEEIGIEFPTRIK